MGCSRNRSFLYLFSHVISGHAHRALVLFVLNKLSYSGAGNINCTTSCVQRLIQNDLQNCVKLLVEYVVLSDHIKMLVMLV